MKIAVLLGGLRFDSPRRIINGIIESAAPDNVSIYVFTCDPWTYSSAHYSRGETTIYTLPDFKSFDGIILRSGAIHDEELLQQVLKKIYESGVPCISISARLEGMMYVGMENANGIYEIVDHLIEVHHAQRINYISGPENSADAVERLKAFKKAMAKHGRALRAGSIYSGDYHAESGKEAIEYFYKLDEPFPDAIVAANDDMALGAFYKLQELGYKVPQQVLLTGYDNSFSGRHHYPKLTSVERPEMELGRLAYSKLKAFIEGHDIEEEELLSRAVFTESCGCHNNDDEDISDLRTQYIKEKIHVSKFSEIIKSSSADFIGAMTFEQLLEMIRKYVKLMELEEFYLCLCDTEDFFGKETISELNDEIGIPRKSSYTPEMYIPIVYRNNEFTQYDKFKVEKLLPDEYTQGRDGVLYTVIPVHYQKRCYGYCVLGNSRMMIDSDMFHLFIMNINNALENVRRQRMLNNMVERLNRMWVYDTLTGIFNRAGFFKFAPNIIEEARLKGNKLFVLFLDLDGLKAVNDKFGHDEGDSFIKAMAKVLDQVRHHGELLMRYGGDEFVVLAQGYTKTDAEAYIEEIQMGIENYNSMSKHPYVLDASMGYSLVYPTEKMDLEALIETADREMYKSKNEKKQKRNKENK